MNRMTLSEKDKKPSAKRSGSGRKTPAPEVGKIDPYASMDFARYPGRGQYGTSPFETDPDREAALMRAISGLVTLARTLESGTLAEGEGLDTVIGQVGRVRRLAIRAGRCSPVPGTWSRNPASRDLPVVLPMPPEETMDSVMSWAANPRGKPPPFKGSPEGHPIARSVMRMGYTGAESAMTKAVQFRISEVTGFKWPNRVILKWMSTMPSFSIEEAKILSYAFSIQGIDLHDDLPGKRRPGTFEASTALDEFARHIRAMDVIPAAAKRYGLCAEPSGPALDRLRLAIICRDGHEMGSLSEDLLMERAGYLLGPKYGKSEFWRNLTDDIPETLAQKISGTCGVESCWITGAAKTSHSALAD